MELTKSTDPSRRLDRTDAALLAAYLLVAVLGTWQSCLLVNDGAVYLIAAWLGNAWDLFYDQNTARAVSTLMQFGLAWALRPAFASTDAFIASAHALYFAVPLVLWLILRRLESQPLQSRLYLAIALSLVFFTSEMVQGIGLWMIWLALVAGPVRSTPARIAVSIPFAALLAFSHPGVALLSLAFALCGGALILLERPFPRDRAILAAAMGLVLTAAYFGLGMVFTAGNPTIAAQQAGAKYDYINPVWMLGTLGFFPVLVALWLLLLAPGLDGVAARWRLSAKATLVVGLAGLWFAFNGTSLLTWIFARQTAPYALALALSLALASPAPAWLAAARRPLLWFAAIMMAASLSYTIDLFLFSRAVDQQLAPLAGDVAEPPRFVEIKPSPTPAVRTGLRGYFKWMAGEDYVRNVVVPDYGGQRMTFAFYTFFESDRRVVMFRPLERRGEWIPFECAPVDRTLARAHDAIDRRMLGFLRQRYCVGPKT